MYVYSKPRVRRTTLISSFFAGVLVGLFAAYFGISIGLYGAVILFISFPILLKKQQSAVLAAILLGSIMGVWRGQAFYAELKLYDRLYGKTHIFYGTISDDVEYSKSSGQTKFHLGSIRSGSLKPIGRIQVITRSKVTVSRSDRVVVEGKLKSSKGTSRQGVIANADVRIISKDSSIFETIRTKFFAAALQALPEPQASLGLGYLVGVRVSIPKELEDQLSLVGLTHIVAVSGYNLTVIVQAVRSAFGKKSAYQSVAVAALLIAGFLAVTGGSAPIVRAAVICGFSLAAWYYGRVIKPVLLLLLSGAITAYVNPLYIWGDPGWYLSFSAFGGVLILGPLLSAWIFRDKPPGTLIQMLLETLCAQICTVPYTLYLFGGVSIIAPIANVFVLPFIPIIMIFVFVSGLVGLFSPLLAAVVGFIPAALLSLQIWLIQMFSKVPGAHAEVNITAYVMVGLFTVILLVILLLAKATRSFNPQQRGLTDSDLV